MRNVKSTWKKKLRKKSRDKNKPTKPSTFTVLKSTLVDAFFMFMVFCCFCCVAIEMNGTSSFLISCQCTSYSQVNWCAFLVKWVFFSLRDSRADFDYKLMRYYRHHCHHSHFTIDNTRGQKSPCSKLNVSHSLFIDPPFDELLKASEVFKSCFITFKLHTFFVLSRFTVNAPVSASKVCSERN